MYTSTYTLSTHARASARTRARSHTHTHSTHTHTHTHCRFGNSGLWSLPQATKVLFFFDVNTFFFDVKNSGLWSLPQATKVLINFDVNTFIVYPSLPLPSLYPLPGALPRPPTHTHAHARISNALTHARTHDCRTQICM